MIDLYAESTREVKNQT